MRGARREREREVRYDYGNGQYEIQVFIPQHGGGR